MLFVQQIVLTYTKAVRGGDFAAARKAVRFLPVEFDKSGISNEIMFNKAELFQSPDGIRELHNRTRILGENVFFTRKFASDAFGERIFVKRAENGYEILYTDKKKHGFIKNKLTLTNGKSGRIIYNNRSSDWECSVWNYFLVTFNFVCAAKAASSLRFSFVRSLISHFMI